LRQRRSTTAAGGAEGAAATLMEESYGYPLRHHYRASVRVARALALAPPPGAMTRDRSGTSKKTDFGGEPPEYYDRVLEGMRKAGLPE
jgi:hypothetical protein